MRWRDALLAIAALFVVTRGALVLLALVLETSVPLGYHGPTYATGSLLTSLTGSDSVYLLGIAAEGYHAEPVRLMFRDWAFFPLYPLVTRAFSALTLGNIAVAGVLVANLAFVAALAVLYRLSMLYLDHDRAVRSLAFVALAPGAVAFAMAYSDSLFLLLAAGAFLAAEHRRWWLMAFLYGLATLTRLQGILLGIPLAILIAESSGGWRSMAGWRSPRFGWLAAGPAAFGLFAAYLGTTFGDPLGMFTAQRAWSQIGQEPTGPVTPVLDRFDPIVLLLVGVLCLYLFLFVFRRVDRPPAAYTALALVTVVTALATGRLQSIGRYLAVAWPFSWTLANRRAAWFELAGLAAFAALFVINAVLHFTQALAP
ncbi:MAG: glycosyltransferase family 39 protein [Chloroflexi bacterium]|nr:glycosyltransferase family 39 protein [Chloroflexota bacterium]